MAAARADHTTAAMTWPPIETAPKDKPLWIYARGYPGAVAGYWNKRGWWSAADGDGSALSPPRYWMLRTEPPAPPDFDELGG